MGLNYELVIPEELLPAYQRESLWHMTVIPCPLVVCLTYMSKVLVLRPYKINVSGKPLISMV